MNERIYNQSVDRLRSKERIKRIDIENVVSLCLRNRNIKTLLDIGTGSGLFAEAFWERGLKVTGIDINPKMIKAAKKFLPNSKFLLASAEKLPFKKESFDAIFFGLAFHEVSDYKKSLAEAYRVSKYFTFILEWKYKKEEFGPPIEHRLKKGFIKNLAFDIGFKKFNYKILINSILYIMEK